MTLTLRQMHAYLELLGRLDRLERAGDLAINAIAARGDNNTIERARRDLTNGG